MTSSVVKSTIAALIALVMFGLCFGPAAPAFSAPATETSSTTTTPEPQTTLPELEDEVMCPTCRTLLNLSHSPAAERERVFIRGMIADGATEEEIKDALVAEYGSQVLALPENEGFNVFAYLVPLLIFLVGG